MLHNQKALTSHTYNVTSKQLISRRPSIVPPPPVEKVHSAPQSASVVCATKRGNRHNTHSINQSIHVAQKSRISCLPLKRYNLDRHRYSYSPSDVGEITLVMEETKDSQCYVSATSAMSVEENPEAVKYLEHLLNEGSEEEDDGRDLELPPWYDEKLFKRGQYYMKKYHFVMFSGMLSGLVAVLAIPSILNVLVCTRQSSTPATAYRRYIRTIFHVLAWYQHPLEKGSKFWESLNIVRKAHLRSSRACAKLKAGRISQKDMALTQFGFIGFITIGAHRISLYDQEFLEGTSHMWRVIGYLLGIKDEYNICGKNWDETKLRLDIAMRKVYQPALNNLTPKFYEMTNALIDGLQPVNFFLTAGSFLFFTRRLAYCKGYELYDADYPNGVRIPNQKQYYYDLGWWDRFLVSYGLFMVTYLHKYNIVRWYLNFRIWYIQLLMYYLPFFAFFKYGIRWSYVRIFSSSNEKDKHVE